jgi:hypothetical protein
MNAVVSLDAEDRAVQAQVFVDEMGKSFTLYLPGHAVNQTIWRYMSRHSYVALALVNNEQGSGIQFVVDDVLCPSTALEPSGAAADSALSASESCDMLILTPGA